MMEKFIVNGKEVQPEEIRVIWTDAFGYDHEGDLWDWRQSEVEDAVELGI